MPTTQTRPRTSPQQAKPPKQGAPNHKRPQQPKPQQKPQQRQPQKRLSSRERRGAQMLLAILTVAFAVYLLLLSSIALLIWYSFSVTPKSETLYALRILQGDENNAASLTRIANYSVSAANNSYGLYVRFSDLAPLCGWGIAGDDTQVTLFLGSDGGKQKDSLTLSRNSSLVEINGSSVRISAPVLFEDNDYLLPVVLFENYIGGLSVRYAEDEQLCRIYVPDDPTFTLKMHRPETAAPCDVTMLPAPSNQSDPPNQ